MPPIATHMTSLCASFILGFDPKCRRERASYDSRSHCESDLWRRCGDVSPMSKSIADGWRSLKFVNRQIELNLDPTICAPLQFRSESSRASCTVPSSSTSSTYSPRICSSARRPPTAWVAPARRRLPQDRGGSLGERPAPRAWPRILMYRPARACQGRLASATRSRTSACATLSAPQRRYVRTSARGQRIGTSSRRCMATA
jgi:hypothetical protein